MATPSALIPPACGLPNIGNSCFLNSLLQALISLWRFIQILPAFRDNELAQKILILVQRMQLARPGLNSGLHTGEIYSRLVGGTASPFLRGGQQDAEECFQHLFDLLALSDGRDKSAVTHNTQMVQSLLGVRYKSSIICTICGRIHEVEAFERTQLWIDIPETTQSETSANEFAIDSDEKVINYIKTYFSYPDEYKCEACGARNDAKTGRFPVRRVRQLVRAGYAMVLINKKYYSKGVRPFPQSFVLEGREGVVYTYNVVAKVEHAGGQAGGHYYTHCKRVLGDEMTDRMREIKRELAVVETNIRDHKVSVTEGMEQSKALVSQLREMDNDSLLGTYLANDSSVSMLGGGLVPTPNTYMIFYSRAE